MGAVVVLPEVIKLETKRILMRHLVDSIEEISKNYRQLLSIFGMLKEIVLPSESEIHAKASTIFERSQLDIVEIPFSLESAKSSFLKVIDKMAPSDKDQQFKDGVIWADCLGLLEKGEVYLVTSDKAFYKDRRYEDGLATALVHEAADYPNKIHIFPTVSDLLLEIKMDVGLNDIELVQRFVETNRSSIEGILSRNNFSIIGEPAVNTGIYATEDPNKLYVEFTFIFNCEDVAPGTRSNAKINSKRGLYIFIE